MTVTSGQCALVNNSPRTVQPVTPPSHDWPPGRNFL